MTFLLSVEAAGQAETLPSPVALVSTPETPIVQKVILDSPNAREVREQFAEVLDQYPATLRDVLRLDPLLMIDGNYLSLYPNLAAFLDRYPEVAHNPSYFVGLPFRQSNGVDMEAIAIMFVIATLVIGAAWLIRTIIDYVRWNRMSRIQAEIHTKPLDRFTANQNLLAYIETSAGRRLLESTPVRLDNGSAAVGAPISRIMFSMQTGMVLILGGLGLHVAIPRLAESGAADGLYVIATLGVALGTSFAFSALTSILLS